MVLRIFSFIILINFLFLNKVKSQQQLFFTDAYHTNLYQNSSNIITFNNNLFDGLNQEENLAIHSIIDTYFKELKIEATKNSTSNNYQISYNYTSSNFEPLKWSKLWHQKYEDTLTAYLNSIYSNYFINLDIKDDEDLVFSKLLYLDKIKHSNSVGTFSSTCINVHVPNINIKKFIADNVAPNQTWDRIITNSILTSYNEAYYFSNINEGSYLYLGPNSKSRLEDCLSLIILKLAYNNVTFNYFNNYTYFTLPTKNLENIDSTTFYSFKNEAFKTLENHINNQSLSFYTIEDLESLTRLKEHYNYNSLKEFISIFIDNNNYTNLTKNKNETYSYFSLVDTINYKINSSDFLTEKDSVELNEIALLLQNNEFRELVIYGVADKNEYLNIEKNKYKALVDKYNNYQPMKISKKVNLSLYRALLVFDYLHKKGLVPQKMMCIGKQYTSTENITEVSMEQKQKNAKLYFSIKK